MRFCWHSTVQCSAVQYTFKSLHRYLIHSFHFIIILFFYLSDTISKRNRVLCCSFPFFFFCLCVFQQKCVMPVCYKFMISFMNEECVYVALSFRLQHVHVRTFNTTFVEKLACVCLRCMCIF